MPGAPVHMKHDQKVLITVTHVIQNAVTSIKSNYVKFSSTCKKNGKKSNAWTKSCYYEVR